ncbi:hypothetical protein GRS96_12415 [Rathayibacter sp. VKM Ac-2803]|nr:hypothetical protein [Rathayibacter sp. VKM Ac-2803]
MVVDFPTLGDIQDAWLAQHARVPNGFARGRRFVQADWQFWALANHYRVRPDAQWIPENPLLNQAFVYRRSQIVGPQKIGKGPWAAGVVAIEGVGPSLFGGWAGKDDGYSCSDWGCGCGWEYAYNEGEPMGIRHPSPLIQLTAISEDQVRNTYAPLVAMIKMGPLSDLLFVRQNFIRVAGATGDDELDRIDKVTSSALSRLGNPITFAMQDESGKATTSNKMVDVYETQRRGAAGMGGRTMETTNTWDPAENSVAQRTHESASTDIFKFWRKPPANLSYRNARERRRIHAIVYDGSPWVNLDSIEAEAAELLEKDPAQAERFFGNRIVAGSGAWFDMARWEAKKAPAIVAPRTRVCLGFDGSENNDHSGIRLETLDGYQFTPTYGAAQHRTYWRPEDWGGRIPRAEVNAAVDELASRYQIVRAYCDVRYWETEIDHWASQHGAEVFIKWRTERPIPMHEALERFRTDFYNPESDVTHDGDTDMAVHLANAIVRSRGLDKITGMQRYILGKPTEHQKIDLAQSGVLAHEAAMDAIAAGSTTAEEKISTVMYGFN